MAATVTTLGIDNIVVRKLVIDPTQRYEYLSTAALLRLTVGLFFVALAAMYCAASPLADSSPHLILIMTLALPFSAIGVFALDLQAIVVSNQAALARASQSVICSLLRLTSALFKSPLVAFAWINTLEGPLFGTILKACHRRVAPAVRFKIPQLSTLAYLSSQAWPLLLSSISVVLYMKMDQIMLKFMCGDLETGIYLAAVRLSELWNFIPIVICSSIYPSILKARETDSVKYAKRMQLLFDGLYFIGLALSVFSTLFAAPIVRTLFGSAYLASIPVLQVHIWSTIAVFLGVASGQWLLAEGLQANGNGICYWRNACALSRSSEFLSAQLCRRDSRAAGPATRGRKPSSRRICPLIFSFSLFRAPNLRTNVLTQLKALLLPTRLPLLIYRLTGAICSFAKGFWHCG